jgi:hypothetical protein
VLQQDLESMNTLQNAFRLLVGLVVAVVSLAIFATLGLAFLGFALVAGISAAIAMKIAGPKRRTARARPDTEPRVWKDGRGKIIDM